MTVVGSLQLQKGGEGNMHEQRACVGNDKQ